MVGEEQRDLFRCWPGGVCVVVVDTGTRRAGLTVSTLVSVSLEPPLVSISLGRSVTLYEPLREAGEWAVSILARDQVHLAQHFARNVPPIALWDRVPVRADDPRLLEGAAGWLVARTEQEVPAGDHVLFLGSVRSLEAGAGAGAVVYLDRRYHEL